MMYPLRRVFHVKIWLTEVSSDDEDNEERIVLCGSPTPSPTTAYSTNVSKEIQKLQDLKYEVNNSLLRTTTCTGNLEINYDGDISEGYETFDEVNYLSCDGDTSTEGSTSPDLLLSNEGQTLNVNAPAFTSVSSMTPVIITKNIDIGNERWKPNATIVEENINAVQVGELPQHFICPDGLYYWPADMNGFQPQPVLLENMPNGTSAVVSEHEPQIYQQQLTGPELVNQAIQNNTVAPKDLPNEELKRLIQLQFEYYFSRENLANDSYLVSQMDGDQFVSISTVSKFNQVRKLTSDMSLIVEALKESPYVQLDETEQKVRANIKRCIVILREIPESTPIEDVKALFASANCPQWISFEYAYNDNWYVTFECEDDAKRAYRYLREEVQSFNGRPLMARIKAKTLLSRTVYLPKNANATATSTQTVTTPPSDSITSQFTTAAAPQPASTFTMATPASATVFHQPHNFPFYTTTPINGNATILPAGWINPRHAQFIPQELRPKNNYNKYNSYPNKLINGQRPFFSGGKPRYPFRNNYNNQKVPFHERNGVADYDDRQNINNANRRPGGGNHSNHIPSNNTNGGVYPNHFRRGGATGGGEDSRFVRYSSGGPRKEYRGNTEESPRFQRLRERRVKDDVPAKPEKPTTTNPENITVNGELTLDLALENFPALPSPNSPNENNTNKSASSLKELATNALNEAEEKNISKDSPSPVSSTVSSESSTELMSTSETSSDSGSPSAVIKATVSPAVLSNNSQTNIPAPKISYAQMAQKPNSNNSKDYVDIDVLKDNEISNGTEMTKNVVNNKSEARNSSSNNGNQTQQKSRERKSSKGSPRTQRSKAAIIDNGKIKTSEKTLDSSNSSNNNSSSSNNPVTPVVSNTSVPLKETYASKFGSNPVTNSDAKTNQQQQRQKVAASNNTNSNTNKGGLNNTNSKHNALPPPRPLMSQVINPPASKINEVNELQQQQQQKSFSDTVKKTGTELAATTPAVASVTTASSSSELKTTVAESSSSSSSNTNNTTSTILEYSSSEANKENVN